MRRRTFLRASVASASAGLAGCSTPLSSGGETATTAPSTDVVTVDITLENRTDRRHSVAVEVAHTVNPVCQYRTPSCERPSTQTVVLDTSFDIAPGDHRSVDPVTMSIERGNETVDTYYIQVETEAATEALNGLEAGGIATVGQAAARDVPWRVAEWEYQVRGLILPEDVEVVLESVG